MEIIIKCNYVEYYASNPMGHPLYYTCKEHLTFLAKYDRETKQYSCEIKEKGEGLWEPEEAFPDYTIRKMIK